MVVYLDTNVYIGAKYVFDREKFDTLRSRISEGNITVLYTTATVGEVLKNLKSTVESGTQSYNRLIKKDLACIFGDETIGIGIINSDDIFQHIKGKLDVFLGLDGVKCIPLNPLDAEKIIADYFAENPPFEKKKPYEFKDAIMINAIKNYQEKTGEEICVVSSDEGFRNAFKNNKNFRTFEFLGNFFKYYQQKQEELSYIENIVADAIKSGEYDEYFEEYCTNLDVDRGDYSEWECVDKTIHEIYCELSYIEETRSGFNAIIILEVSLTADINYRDEDTSYYDKEEGRYLIENFISAVEKHRVSLELKTKCEFEIDDVGNKSLINIEIINSKYMPTLELDDNTMYDFDEISNTFEESSDVEYCSECEKVIGKYSDVLYFDYHGNPICSECAVTNSSGQICPGCGRKIPHDLMSSSFCIDCSPEHD